MTSRERVLQAVQHREPDRVPLFYRDVPEVDARLRRDLGLQSRDELLEWFQVDFRWVEPVYVGPPLKDETTGRRRDIWGVEYSWTMGAGCLSAGADRRSCGARRLSVAEDRVVRFRGG